MYSSACQCIEIKDPRFHPHFTKLAQKQIDITGDQSKLLNLVFIKSVKTYFAGSPHPLVQDSFNNKIFLVSHL